MSLKEVHASVGLSEVTTGVGPNGSVVEPRFTTPALPTIDYRIASVGGKKRHFKPCLHTKNTSSFNPGSYSWQLVGAPSVTYTTTCATALFVRADTTSVLYAPRPSTWVLDMGAASARAYTAMKPSLGSGLNLSVFLAELKDVRRMFQILDSKVGFTKNLAGGHLNYSFGWKPFIRDCKDIVKAVLDWEVRLDEFIKRANRPQHRRYQETPSWSSSYSGTSSTSSGTTKRWTGTLQEVKYTANMKYVYAVPSYGHNEMRWRAILDTLGLNLNPSTFWELVPFSFLVDWFVNVGDTLSSRETDWLEPIMTIVDFCHTLKYKFGYVMMTKRGTGGFTTIATHTASSYDRRVVIPQLVETLVYDPSLTGSKVLIAGSLIIANSR